MIGELIDPLSNINRSPSAYANNPPEERAKYKYNVDKLMVSLRYEIEIEFGFLSISRFEGENGPIGALNWFAVHGTSMNNTNRFISGYSHLRSADCFLNLIETIRGMPRCSLKRR